MTMFWQVGCLTCVLTVSVNCML